MRARNQDQFRHECLDELLGDPIVALMMSDGVDPTEVRALLRTRRPVRTAMPGRPKRLGCRADR